MFFYGEIEVLQATIFMDGTETELNSRSWR